MASVGSSSRAVGIGGGETGASCSASGL
jgi:hypothetical protein